MSRQNSSRGQVVPAGLVLSLRSGWAGLVLSLLAVYIQKDPRADFMTATAIFPALGWYVLDLIGASILLAPVIAMMGECIVDGRRPRRIPWRALAAGWRLGLAALIYNIGVGLGLLLFLVPGVLLSLAWVLYGPAVVWAEAGPVSALGLAYARARRDWAGLLRRIAGPYAFYGVVYVIGALPVVWSLFRSLSGGGVAAMAARPDVLVHLASPPAEPAWFAWGLMPLLLALAQWYLLAGVTGAWFALEPAEAGSVLG